MRVAVAGASGFVGRRLTALLAQDGHDVVALGRRRASLPAGDHIEPVVVDVADGRALQAALAGCTAAYYLVHSMGGPDFARRDRELAATFAERARAAGITRIVYLGGIGTGKLSAHLASRQETGRVLASTGLDVVELRAGVVLGAGSISFEMMRYLVERLPAMVCPRWVRTRIEPIAFGDVLAYLRKALTVPAGVYDIGCGEALAYERLMQRYAAARGLRPRLIVNVPLLTLRLSSYWVDFVTPVDQQVSHSLIESLAHEVVVADHARTDAAFGLSPAGIDDALRTALEEQAAEISVELLRAPEGLLDGTYVVRREVALPPDVPPGAVARDLERAGGRLSWYGIAAAWRLRIALGRLVGEHLPLRRPRERVPGEKLDWWTIQDASEGTLTLRADWGVGEAWLGYRERAGHLVQAAAFRPRGVPGFLYWQALRPAHRAAFEAMLAARVRAARRAKSPGG